MVDINDDTENASGGSGDSAVVAWSGAGAGRLRRRGRIVAEAIAPRGGGDRRGGPPARSGARGILSNWIRAAKDGRFALSADDEMAFVREWVAASEPVAEKVTSRGAPIEIRGGLLCGCVFANGADARTLDAVMPGGKTGWGMRYAGSRRGRSGYWWRPSRWTSAKG